MTSPEHNERIAILGLGYVGLPVARAMARTFSGTIGFDLDPSRIDELRHGLTETGSLDAAELDAGWVEGQFATLERCRRPGVGRTSWRG